MAPGVLLPRHKGEGLVFLVSSWQGSSRALAYNYQGSKFKPSTTSQQWPTQATRSNKVYTQILSVSCPSSE